MVKNPPANAGHISDMGSISRLGRSLGGGHGNPLSILAWETPRTEESGGLQTKGSQRLLYNLEDFAHTHTHLCCTVATITLLELIL